MDIKKQFMGYDCSEVNAFILEIEEDCFQKSEALVAQSLAQAKKNLETFKIVQELSKQFEESRLQEKLVINRLLEQTGAIEEAYKKGQRIIVNEKYSAEEQIEEMNRINKMLYEISLQFSDA